MIYNFKIRPPKISGVQYTGYPDSLQECKDFCPQLSCSGPKPLIVERNGYLPVEVGDWILKN